MTTIFGDRWKIGDCIGEGGQAHAFIVTDIKGDSSVQYVLKRLKNLKRLDRFKREIEAVRNLNHPYILRLIDFDIDAPKPYLVTEYCLGGSLEKAKPIWNNSPIKALELFQQICEGVLVAHSHGIIHRDIKPSNIYLRNLEGPAVIGDFGICYIEQNGERITLTEEAIGPRLFMAPELEGGRVENITPKCDIYSLGKVLYWLLSNGKMLPREKHREVEYDLKGKNDGTLLGWNNIYMEHINRILDVTIVADPEKRRNADNLLILIRKATRLISKEFTPIDKELPRPCTYCGQGVYREIPISSIYSGLHLIDIEKWQVFICNACGHVQFFHIDKSHNIEWWKT
jgi:serine/threonine protein kinase